VSDSSRGFKWRMSATVTGRVDSRRAIAALWKGSLFKGMYYICHAVKTVYLDTGSTFALTDGANFKHLFEEHVSLL
jgi:hypothetical protein